MVCVGLELKYWPQVKDAIQEALQRDGGRLGIDDMYEFICDNKMQLWAIHDGDIHAVMTTEIVNYMQMRCVRIITVTGKDSEQWLDLLIETISAWGAENGAHAVEFVGRKGWEKVLSKRGFGNTQVFMTRKI